MGIIAGIIVGLIAGWLAGLVMNGSGYASPRAIAGAWLAVRCFPAWARPVVVAQYGAAALALAAQGPAAKMAVGAAPPLGLSTVRFAIASALLVVVAL